MTDDFGTSMKQQQQQADYFNTPSAENQAEKKPELGTVPLQKETINEAIDGGNKGITKQWTQH
jgi:hypothetical protein